MTATSGPHDSYDSYGAPGAQGAHRVEIAAPLGEVRFPNLCTRCAGTPPAGALNVTRMFRRTHSESPTTYVFDVVRAPFCADCLARHAAEHRPVDPAVLRKLRLTWALKVLPYVLPICVIVFFLIKIFQATTRGLGRSTDVSIWALALGFGIFAFFALSLLSFVHLSLKAGRPLIAHDRTTNADEDYVEIVPGLFGAQYVVPGPPTSTLGAVSFSDEEFMMFESNKRAFTFTNSVVAEQFAALNADLVWTPDSPRAVRGARKRYAAVVAVIVIGGAYVLWELLLAG